MVSISDFLFYFVLFKMKKIEITLNPKFVSADDVINELLNFFSFVRFSVFIIILGIIFKIASSFYFLFNHGSDNPTAIESLRIMVYVFISYNFLFFFLQLYFIYYF